MYQPQYAENHTWQQQQQQQQNTYEYKPVTAPEVYPVEPDPTGQLPVKQKRDRPDYRPIPLRWPFISTLILVLLALMGLTVYAVRTLKGSDNAVTIENRSLHLVNENLYFIKRQDDASAASEAAAPETVAQPTDAAAAEPEATNAADPGPTDAAAPEPTDAASPADGEGESGRLTTALVESVYTSMVTEPGSIEVVETTETITETGQVTVTQEVVEEGTPYVTAVPPPSTLDPTDAATYPTQYRTVQPEPVTSLVVATLESGVVRTTVRQTTRTGPPITYASVGTTTLYKVLTLDAKGEPVKGPVTEIRTSEVPATVKTVVDAPPPTTILQTLPDGQVLTSVSTPLATTRVTTVPATKVIITDVSAATDGTRIVVEATTHTLTHEGYFIGKFLPPILAVLLAMAIRALNQAAQQYQPFAALTREGGALGREALLLSFDGWMSFYLPFKLLFNNQPLPFLTALAVWASGLVAPFSSEAIGLKIYGRCTKGAIDGCALELGVSKNAAYALVALLGAITILLAVTLSVISRHWRTGVFANPWCAANTAALVARNPEIRPLASSDWKALNKSVADKRFAMGWYRNQEGRDEYGLVICDDMARETQAPYVDGAYTEGMAYRPQTHRRAPQTFMALSFWYRFSFLLFLICLTGFVGYYHFVDTYGHMPKKMRKLMESQDFGVRFVSSALGVVVIFCWDFLFTSVAIITPFRRMAQDPQVPTRSVLVTPATNPVSGVFVALRIRDPLLFFTAFAAVLAQFLPILLANVPYSLTQTSDAHNICSRLSVGILFLMAVAMGFSLLVKWPDLPVDPSNLAGALWYVADAPWLRSLEGVAAMSASKRRDAVRGLGGSWTYGPIHTPMGDRFNDAFQCSFEQDGSRGQYEPHLPPKVRAAKACRECRAMKVRCSGDAPTCNNCQRRNKQCTYSSPKTGQVTSEPSSSRDDSTSASASTSQATVSPEQQRSSLASSSQSGTLDSVAGDASSASSLSDEMAISLTDQYFEQLYPLPAYSFLHQATVIQRCRDKTIDRALKLALCSITSIYFDKHHTERDSWAHEAEKRILDRLEEPSIFKIQASLLLIRYRAAVGQFPRAFIMAGLAGRWAVALRLNYEHSRLSPVAQEVRRRTFWSLFLLEDSFCVGLKEFGLFDPDIIHLQLPCEDVDFHQERVVGTGYLQPGKGLEPEVMGSRAAFVRLAFIRRAIMRLNRRISMKEANLSDLFSSMERFQNDLLRLQTKLAPGDQYPPVNPQEQHPTPQYVSMHMSWHQCHCDLYRIFLTEYPESTPHATIDGVSVSEKALMKDKCLSHAEQIIKVLSDFVQHKDDGDMLEFDAAICAYHAARLVLFGTYTGRDNNGISMQMAISKAQLCLDVVTRYFGFSAQLKSMASLLHLAIGFSMHKLWLESSDHRAVSTVDAGQPPSKLSKDAYIRQRLAIHSLLRQSDFVDDSRDAAPPEPALSTEEEQAPPAPQTDWGGREPYPLNDPIKDPNMLFGLPYGGVGLDLNAWACAETQDMNGCLVDPDEQDMY
ncbi:hypothetical protein F66182_8426 [Fusarium sp. NRRL 66182]|nr:hypothetical protein F66182_8426 [Fusarium sp. NRRL 66182]